MIDLYKRARMWWLKTQVEQMEKGLEKYGRPLDPQEWTSEQLVEHIMQESVDLVHYVMALREKCNELERRLSKYERP